MSSANANPVHASAAPAPSLPLMHLCALLTGIGTLLLGPILPLLAGQWHLTDARSGLLVTAQFCGSVLGGFTTFHRLRMCFAQGLWAAALGFVIFAFSPGLPLACAGLALGGFGVGRIITANNIIAGRRHTTSPGAALARLNFSWSLGALLSPILAAWLTPRVSLRNILASFATLFLFAAIRLFIESRNAAPELRSALDTPAIGHTFPRTLVVYFMALLCLYGGLETCFSVWLTTFAQRFGRSSLVLSDYTLVLLLAGLTAGRAAASALLPRIHERTLARISLAVAAALAAALASSRQPATIAVLAVLLGFALAPIFPAIFGNLLGYSPPARIASVVLAVSGLGAASFPWLMGFVSTRTGSLGIALSIPAATALVMLLLTMIGIQKPQPFEPKFPPTNGIETEHA